jgi:hypothetical protein
MLTYILSGSNTFSIRTKTVQPASDGTYNFGSFYLQDMTTLDNSTMTLSGVSYNPYESIFSFTGSISTAITGSEYRAYLTDINFNKIWNGSVQVLASQSWEDVGKSTYRNQIPIDNNFVSNVSENKYIILQ